MPFHERLIEWAETMIVCDDRTAGMGAPDMYGGNRGFAGMLVPTVHLLHVLEELDLQSMPAGFSVPAGTAMWVLLVFNAVDGMWQAADVAGPGHVKQRLHSDNTVHNLFGHTLHGAYGNVHTFGQSFVAYVQSGGLKYFALMSLLQHIPITVYEDRSILHARAEDTISMHAPPPDTGCNYTPFEYSSLSNIDMEMGGLDMFHNISDSLLDMEHVEMREQESFSNSLYDPRGMWDKQDDFAERDDDQLSQANTPVSYKPTAEPVSFECSDFFLQEQSELPESFLFGEPVALEMARIEPVAPPVEQVEQVDSLPMKQAQPLADKHVPPCKRQLQLDVPCTMVDAPSAKPPAPSKCAPVEQLAKKKKTSSPQEPRSVLSAATEAQMIEHFLAQHRGEKDYSDFVHAPAVMMLAFERLGIVQRLIDGSYDGTYDGRYNCE